MRFELVRFSATSFEGGASWMFMELCGAFDTVPFSDDCVLIALYSKHAILIITTTNKAT